MDAGGSVGVCGARGAGGACKSDFFKRLNPPPNFGKIVESPKKRRKKMPWDEVKNPLRI